MPNSAESFYSFILLGGGGHARSIFEVLREHNAQVVGYVDPFPSSSLELPLLSADIHGMESLITEDTRFVLAVGDNRRRRTLTIRAREDNIRIADALVSLWAHVADDAVVGVGSVIMPGAIVRTGAKIGQGAIINTGAIVDHDCSLGDFVHVGPGAVMAGGVRAGLGAFIGAGARCIPGVQLGEWSVLGSGAVCIGDVPRNKIAHGIPARVTRTVSN